MIIPNIILELGWLSGGATASYYENNNNNNNNNNKQLGYRLVWLLFCFVLFCFVYLTKLFPIGISSNLAISKRGNCGAKEIGRRTRWRWRSVGIYIHIGSLVIVVIYVIGKKKKKNNNNNNNNNVDIVRNNISTYPRRDISLQMDAFIPCYS